MFQKANGVEMAVAMPKALLCPFLFILFVYFSELSSHGATAQVTPGPVH